ncbi:hypothetical protein BDW22DRAFT_1355040 [Trametopsis cervina]|nr:hypothetical protein BDW22DRAFT_1355040 [Trametopsis cervina]
MSISPTQPDIYPRALLDSRLGMLDGGGGQLLQRSPLQLHRADRVEAAGNQGIVPIPKIRASATLSWAHTRELVVICCNPNMVSQRFIRRVRRWCQSSWLHHAASQVIGALCSSCSASQTKVDDIFTDPTAGDSVLVVLYLETQHGMADDWEKPCNGSSRLMSDPFYSVRLADVGNLECAEVVVPITTRGCSSPSRVYGSGMSSDQRHSVVAEYELVLW